MPKSPAPRGMSTTIVKREPIRERKRLKVNQPTPDQLDAKKLKERRLALEERQETREEQLSKLVNQLRSIRQNLEAEEIRFNSHVSDSHEKALDKSADAYLDAALKSSPKKEKLDHLESQVKNLEQRKTLFEQELREIAIELAEVSKLQFEVELRTDISQFAKDFKKFQDHATSLANSYDQIIHPMAAALKQKAEAKKAGPRIGWSQRLINAGLSVYEVEALTRVISGGYTGPREFVEYLSWLRTWNKPENPFYAASSVKALSVHESIGFGEKAPASPDAGADQAAEGVAQAIMEM